MDPLSRVICEKLFNFTKKKPLTGYIVAERKLRSSTILGSGLRIFDYEPIEMQAQYIVLWLPFIYKTLINYLNFT